MRAKLLIRAAKPKSVAFQGLPVEIEWPKGSVREGTDKDGKPWKRTMHCDYGYVPDTVAKGDKEDLDVYLGPNSNAPNAYVIEQLKEDGSFDEPKGMLGFDSEDEARAMYLKHYPAGWESRIGEVHEVTVKRLQEMVDAEQTVNEQRVMEAADEMMDQKTERFLTEAEVLDTFYKHVLPRPGYQQALKELGGGQPYKSLDRDTRNRICDRGRALELEHGR